MVSIGDSVKVEPVNNTGEVIDVNPDDMTAKVKYDGAMDGSGWWSVDELTLY